MIQKKSFLRAILSQMPKTSNLNFQLRHPKVITPQYVELSLKRCNSDVDTLKLFLWFAHQPNYFHDHQSFDYMVPVVSRLTHRFDSVNGVVKELENDGCSIKGQTFLMLLRIYSRGEMYDMALKAFDEMENYGYTPNTFVRNIVLDVFFKTGDMDKAIEFFRETKSPNFLTYNTALCHLYKLNNLLGVCYVMVAMVTEGFQPNLGTFFMVLDCLCKAGGMEEALQVLGLMIISGIPLTVNVWSVLIDGFCRVGEFEIASQLLEKMVEAGHAPNVVTYTFLIKGFMKYGISDRARAILMIMESKGCIPDLFLYNVLMHGMSKLKGCNNASLALRERKLQPDSYTLSSYFIKSGFLPRVVDIYNDILNRGLEPDGYSYAGLLSALCSAGKFDYAIKLYQGIVRTGLCFDAHITAVMTDELIKVGKCQAAITLFKEAIAKNLPLDVVSYTVWIKGLVKDGRLEEVYSLYRRMKERGVHPNTCTCNYMLHCFCKARDFELIKWLVKEMVDTPVKPDCATFKIISRFLKISCRVCSASVQNLGMKCNKCTCVSLVDYIDRAGRVGEAFIPLWKVYSEDMLFIDSTDSDDIPDVAASFG